MGMVNDICTKTTNLTPAQINQLDKISSVFMLVSDIAHAQATIYAKAINDNMLVIVSQARPNTSFIQYKPNLLGSTVYAAEEPLIWRTMKTGEAITGQREWAFGMWIDMQTFPLYDKYGDIIAVVSFETSTAEAKTEGHSVLVQTAYMLLVAEKTFTEANIMRPVAASDGIVIADENGMVVYANAAAHSIYKMLGVGLLHGQLISDRKLNMRIAYKASRNQTPYEAEIAGGTITLLQRAIPIIRTDQTVRTLLIVADVTELKKKEKELLIKSAVIQEIHHRVKNNLQTIASLLRLQARRATFPEVKAALRESVNRILSISVVHEFLSQQDEELIDVAEVAKNILDLVIQNMLEPGFNLQTIFNGHTIILPSEQASSLALVINELIQNSIEHGFTGRPEGVIGINISEKDDCYQIEIYDNGVGLPPDFDAQKLRSLGLQIIRTLIETDLGGNFRLYSDNGTHACIIIPRILEGGR